MNISSKYPSTLVFFVAICASLALVWGQFQVNPQVQRQVNTALYATGSKSSVRYAKDLGTSLPMRSEVRYAYWKSGALPSDIRMGYAKVGPLAPGGPMSYIPPSSASYLPQRSTAIPGAMGASAYINYRAPAAATSVHFAAPKFANSAYTGSISPPPSSSRKISPTLSGTSSMSSPSLSSSSIRYNP